MFKRTIALTALIFCVADRVSGTEKSNASDNFLYGIVVVVDAGHGGIDPGASGYFHLSDKKIRVVEAEYVADVARRLTKIIRTHGGIVINTVVDKHRQSPIAENPQQVLRPDQNEIYSFNGQKVRGGRHGLMPRMITANQAFKRYPRHRKLFISIHFDENKDQSIEGVHLVAPPGRIPEFVKFLKKEFQKSGYLRTRNGAEFLPIVQSGDQSHGMRNLFVLDPNNNMISQRVLIELGNFCNARDVWRIRNYTIREEYAQIITRALIKFNNGARRQ